eukprot:3538627-Pleurochrysis_carterae.AAC.2
METAWASTPPSPPSQAQSTPWRSPKWTYKARAGVRTFSDASTRNFSFGVRGIHSYQRHEQALCSHLRAHNLC